MKVQNNLIQYRPPVISTAEVMRKGSFNFLRKVGKMNFNKMEIETIIEEAFITGRIYTTGGEKETPIEIRKKLRLNIKKALRMICGEKSEQKIK